MQSGTTLIVVKKRGLFEEGMTFTCLGVKKDYVFLWAHDRNFSDYELKVSLSVVKDIMRPQDYRILGNNW